MKNNVHLPQAAAGGVALCIALASPAFATLNPQFTPVDLAQDAEQVLKRQSVAGL